MQRSPIIQIPVKNHIKCYLKALFGPEEPISFPKRHDYNTFLIKKLGRPPIDYRPSFVKLTQIHIQAPETGIKNLYFNNYLARDNQEILRRNFDRHFISDYHAFIELKLYEGWNRNLATKMFMDLYNITDDDLSFSAFYRDFSRIIEKRRAIHSISEY